MRDAVNINNIPVSTPIVATYINGLYAVNEAAYVERFPTNKRVLIDVNGLAPGKALARDWETGDKSGSLETWVADAKKDGTAIVYCNKSTIAEVRQLTGSQILGKDYFLWVATLDGSEYRGGTDGVTSGDVVACQTHTAWAGSIQLYDESVVYADWWLADPPPTREPISALPGGSWLKDVRISDGTWHAVSTNHGATWGHPDPGA